MLLTRRPQSDPALLDRMDPGYWRPAYDDILAGCWLPLAPLGEFIAHITYGPIVTGKTPPLCTEGVRIVHQGQVTDTGVDLRDATIVPEGSDWDRPNARLEPEDIVLPRSGVASVAKNRVAIHVGAPNEFSGSPPAAVGSFVDLIRLEGLDPFYALICLKTQLVWSQIHRAINGVGTPNICFDEIRALQMPVVGEGVQGEYRAGYLETVQPLHLEWLAGDNGTRDEAVENLKRLIARLDAATGC